MLFNSVQYLVFAPLVICLYFWLPAKFQRFWLLIASLYFYAIFKIPFVLLLIYSIVLTYYAVKGMEVTHSKFLKLFFLNVAVWGNLILLYLFKYMDFSIHAWNVFTDSKPCDPSYVSSTGAILPMGISFLPYRRFLTRWMYTAEPFDKRVVSFSSDFFSRFFLNLSRGRSFVLRICSISFWRIILIKRKSSSRD